MYCEKTISINPANGETIGEFRVHFVENLAKIMQDARSAQPEWHALPVRERAGYLLKTRDYIADHIDQIAETISRENGKTRMEAMATEILNSAMAVSYYCKMAPKFLKDRKIKTGNIMFSNKKSRISRVPFGVVGIISPWNYPLAIPFAEIVMALLAGNTVVFKAASQTQMVGHMIKECLDYAGLPPGVFNYINIPGSLAGDALLDAGIDKLFFTGSVPVGKYLMKKAAETLTPVSLELGGNDAMIVCEDADLKRAATGAAWAGFVNAGQSCGGVERIYVQQNVFQEFSGYLKKEVEALRTGSDVNGDVEIGAMTMLQQMDVVNRHIQDALDKGARIYAQNKVEPGLNGQFMPCTVLTDVNHDMLVMKEETFGPVVGIMPFDQIDQAIEYANDSTLGLSGSVWSKDRKKAKQIAGKIRAGAIAINDHLISHALAETPWGGFKESGIGRTHGDLGFAEMTEPQVIVDDILSFAKKNLWWPPYSASIYEGIKGLTLFLYGKGLKVRMGGALKLLKIFPRTFRSSL